MIWQCRMAPSLGSLENTPEEVWGTKPYKNRIELTVFFGLYDLRDYIALFRHKGTKAILWAGGDIENLIRGFVLNDGKLKWLSRILWGLPRVLSKKLAQVPNYVENDVERAKLERLGIHSKVVPSFLGKIEDFPVCYKHADHPKVFISGHPGREKEYGFEFIEKIAKRVPECYFGLYGAEWKSNLPNVRSFGKVSKERFNREIRNYQCGLRPNTHDGFSEITAKSILMGQWPITKIKYPHISHYETDDELVDLLKGLKNEQHPNYLARGYYISAINKYPWNKYATK